ncbi:copper homeostasis protein CutC [Maritalea sp.]|uniref:copper homeostasis protein CutC n=1 Tax=Maritalea sp. TaxID=2003361 RepID=UPI003EF3C2D9
MSKITLEVCVDSLASLKAAKDGGADRIELCAALSEGGLTPSAGFMRAAKELGISTHAMIRPRGGDFCYSAQELQLMLQDIEYATQVGLDGVVVGASLENDQLDLVALEQLRLAAGQMECTLHRAIDLTPNPVAAVEQVIEIGFTRILTSGGKKTATDGAKTIAEMNDISAGRIQIMPGSGISSQNAVSILNITNANALHASCSKWSTTASEQAIAMGFAHENGARETSVDTVKTLRKTVDSFVREAAYV